MTSINIHSQDFRVTGSLEEFATRKLERLYRYLSRIDKIELDLTRQRTRRGEALTTAQITLRHERGAILRAEESTEGETTEAIEAAISHAVEKMYRQIERFKGKRRRNKGKTRFSATLEELSEVEDIPEEMLAGSNGSRVGAVDIDDDYSEVEPEIVRHKRIDVMPISELEAIEQMELLGHPFFVFFNEANNSINVLYRRSDGSYGVLVPQMA